MFEERAPAPAFPPARATRGASGERCPKCKRVRRRGERACPRCGLLASRFAHYAAAAREEPEPIAGYWLHCRENWLSPAAHTLLLDVAVRLQCVPAVARRYREVLDEEPDEPIAARNLQRLTLVIERAARAQVGATVPRHWLPAMRMAGWVVASMLLVLAVWILAFALRAR
jgi:hypothetical protein